MSDEAAAATATASVRVAFWNTWLLSPRLWSKGPRLPGMAHKFAPDVELRAPMVGEALRGRFDVAALSECFEDSECAAVSAAWPEATLVQGPRRRPLRMTSSGLAALIGPDVRLVRSANRPYRADGDHRDSDRLASKGAQFVAVEVHPDLPPVEVISTHLFAGGDLLPRRGHDHVARHHEVRMAQVDELIGFIEREHDPASPLLVVGDFNVKAQDPDLSLPDHEARYRDLAAHMARAQLIDVWATHGIGPGHTCTFTSPEQLPPDPDEPDRLLDEAIPGLPPGIDEVIAEDDVTTGRHVRIHERIDYLWLSTPAGVTVDVERPRRWAFSGRPATGGPGGSLSDHLAVSVTLNLST